MTKVKPKLLVLAIVMMTAASFKSYAQTPISASATTSPFFEVNKNRQTGTPGFSLLGYGTFTDWFLSNWDGDFRIHNASATNLVTVKPDGKFGIGTTTPSEKLEIQDGNLKFFMLNGAGGKTNYIEFRENHNAQTDFMRMEYTGLNVTCCGDVGDYLRFKSNAGDIMVMERASKEVGINKATPSYTLDVNGTVNATEYRLNGTVVNFGGSSQWTTSGTNIYYSTGNVGIGNTAPAAKLDVTGNVKVTGNLMLHTAGTTLPTGITTAFSSSKLLTDWGANWSTAQTGYNAAEDGAAYRMDMRTTTAPVFSWFYRPAGVAANTNQTIASLSKEGNFWTKYLSVSADYPASGEQNEHLIAGTVAHFDGRVYVSEVGGLEKGFVNQLDSNYKDFLLWVEEGIVSKDFAIVNTTDWPDYVFHQDYKLPSLSEVAKSIKENGHLPTMPSAQEVEKNGFTVNDMTKRTVKTIEELTLHIINQEKKIEELLKRIEKLEKQ